MLTAQLYCYAEAWRLRHRPPVAAPRSGPGGALASRRLARGADPAAGVARRTRRSPLPPATATWPLAAIRWRLEREIPAAWLPVMALAV
jgi:hypothetical protein